MEQVGWTGIGLMNVLLAGFIAYSIADKSGLAAGFIGGALASSTNAGFIGAVDKSPHTGQFLFLLLRIDTVTYHADI